MSYPDFLKEVVVFDDMPIHDFEHDRINRRPEIEHIKRILERSGSMVLAVTGGWGTGKSSFCRLLQSHLAEDGEQDALDSAKSIRFGLIYATELDDPSIDIPLNLIRVVTYGDHVEAQDVIARLTSSGASGLRLNHRKLRSWIQDRLAAQRVRGSEENDRILLIIDDLDRVATSVYEATLRVLLQYIGLPELAVVLASERDALLKAAPDLQRGNASPAQALRSLEKYIRYELELSQVRWPSLSDDASLSEFVRGLRRDYNLMEPQFASGISTPSGQQRRGGQLLDFGAPRTPVYDGVTVGCADELILAAFSSGITIRKFKRIMTSMLVGMARNAGKHVHDQSEGKGAFTWEGLEDYLNDTRLWFPDPSIQLFDVENAQTGLVAWKRCLLETIIRVTLDHTWPKLVSLMDRDLSTFRRVFAVLAATGQGGRVFENTHRGDVVRSTLPPDEVELPDEVTLKGLSRLAAFADYMTRGTQKFDESDASPFKAQTNFMETKVDLEESLSQPGSGHRVAAQRPEDVAIRHATSRALQQEPDEARSAQERPPSSLRGQALELWRLLDRARTSSQRADARTAISSLSVGARALAPADLRQLYDLVINILDKYSSLGDIAIAAGNLAVVYELSQLPSHAYGIHRLHRRKGLFDPSTEAEFLPFRLTSQYISFLEDTRYQPDFDESEDHDIDSLRRQDWPQSEIKHWLGLHRALYSQMPDDLQARFDRFDAIGLAKEEFAPVLEAKIRAVGPGLSREKCFALLIMMRDADLVRRDWIRHLLENGDPAHRDAFYRGAADVLASSSSLDDERAAVWLYLAVRKAGGSLWNAATRHNLATLLFKHERHLPTVFRLWKEALRETPNDDSIRRSFGQFLGRQGHTEAAMSVLMRGEINERVQGFKEADEPDSDPYYQEFALENWPKLQFEDGE